MPTYRCTTPRGLLTQAQRARLAAGITRVHNEVTGAATFFAQVLFDEIAEGSYFVGGRPLEGPQVFVHGTIRAGRSAADLHRLITALTAEVAAGAEREQAQVWVYVSELSPSRMVEYGHVLPNPGGEQAWFDGLPESLRAKLAKK